MNQALIDMLNDARSKMLQDMLPTTPDDFFLYQQALSHVERAMDQMQNVENS